MRFQIKDVKSLKVTGIILLVYILAHIFFYYHGASFYINTSASQPAGIYRAIKFDGHMDTGDLVLFQPPENAHPYVYGRGWMKKGRLMLKNVGAIAGDRYQITDAEITINDQYVGPIYKVDSEGLPMPRLRGVFKVEEGEFLPLSTYIPNSFDGRYFGAVSTKQIKAKAVLVYRFKNQKKTNTSN